MSTAEVTAEARLSADQSQAVFRWLLDALSRPGLPIPVPPGLPGDIPAVLLGPLALADVDTSVAVVGGAIPFLPPKPAARHGFRGQERAVDWGEVLRTAIGSRCTALAEADMVVALRPPTPGEISSLRRGSAETPERGARLFAASAALCTGSRALARDPVHETGRTALRVEGPGVPGARRVAVEGVPAEVFAAIAAANRGYPAGIDTWLVAGDGSVVGLPRSSRVTIEEVG